MSRLMTRLTVLTLVALTLATPSARSATPCTDTVTYADASGDPMPASLDITSTTVSWQPRALHVGWSLSSPLSSLPDGVDAIRLAIVGFAPSWALSYGDGPPYVYVDATRTGAGITWTAGLGTYAEPADGTTVAVEYHSRPGERWIESWRTPIMAPNTTDISFDVPISHLTRFMSSIGMVAPAGTTADAATSGEASRVIFGVPASPTAIVATRAALPIDAGTPSRWVIADAAPNNRLQGDAETGYSFSDQPGDIGYAPDFCRVTRVVSGTPVNCDLTVDVGTPGWTAVPIDLEGVSPDGALHWLSGVTLSAGAAVAAGVISPNGDALMTYDWFGAPHAATINLAGNRYSAGDGGTQSVGHDTDFDSTIVLPHAGRWWLVVISAGNASGFAYVDVAAPGATCGEARTGPAAWVTPDQFTSTAAAAVSSLADADVTLDGSYLVEAGAPLFALLTGGGFWRYHVDEPGGSTQTTERVCCTDPSVAGLFEFGQAGAFDFHIDRHASRDTSAGLLIAPMKLD